jgi:hypothetical protein
LIKLSSLLFSLLILETLFKSFIFLINSKPRYYLYRTLCIVNLIMFCFFHSIRIQFKWVASI